MEKKIKHGGPRPGAGRPKSEPTTTLSYRVPAALAPVLREKITALIKREQAKLTKVKKENVS